MINLPSWFHPVIEGHADAPGFVVEVHRYTWTEPHQAVFRSDHLFVDLVLSNRPPKSEGIYIEAARPKARPIGELLFVPAKQSLGCQWQPGEQHSICCSFDPAMDDEGGWADRRLEATLDVRSNFIRAAMIRLSQEIAAPGFASGLLVDSVCRAIMIDMKRYFGAIDTDTLADARTLTAAQISRVEERIDSSAGAMPSLATLAADCGLSVRHFSRMFRNATGRTVTDFAAARRIMRAKTMLADGRNLIKEIAFECGFATPAAFTAAFRKATGYSPREFRGR